MEGDLSVEVLRGFGLALAIGGLIGIEREKKKSREGDVGLGGIRTFILIAEAGAVSTWLALRLESAWPLAAALVGVTALVSVGYLLQIRAGEASFGLTTEVAAVVTLLLGGLCVAGAQGPAVALAIATSAVLAYKQPLHALVNRLGTEDIYAGLKLLVATFIVLPLLPNRTLDPWDALNPYELWWLVILIASLSLVGYVATRWLGPGRGAALTGLSGGLVSSTAVSLSFARRSREDTRGDTADALTAGVLLAWSVMFGRVVVEVAVVEPGLLPDLLVPFVVLGACGLGLAGWHFRRGRRSENAGGGEVGLDNPFSVSAAVQFAVLFAVVLLAVRLAEIHAPEGGILAVAALAGLTDVDAITLSMARLARDGGDAATAVNAIVVAALANTLTKAGLVAFLGGTGMRERILRATAILLAAGAVATLAG